MKSVALFVALSFAADETPESANVLIEGMPYVQQKPDFCGEACAEMVLQKLKIGIDQDEVFARTGVDPALGRGAWTKELKVALEDIGFDIGQVWYTAANEKEVMVQWSSLYSDLQQGIPSIICTHFDEQPNTTEHFRLIVGYDAGKDDVIYHDPAIANGSYLKMDKAQFLRLWPLKYNPKQWTIVRFRLPGEGLTGTQTMKSNNEADYAQKVMAMKPRVPAGFTIVVEPPFVVVGDEPAPVVQRRAQNTVAWSVSRLKKDYFKKNPDDIWEIWLFNDKRSYEHHAWTLFGDKPDTPYGYASSEHNALVMNIATGGGTLVHEIVHPFLDANFENVPSWFNEGLASLYEQSSSRGDHIVGLTNWRLAGLQEAIEADSVPAFKWLMAQSTNDFYNRDPGTNYAQSRYLLYYLQEKGLLVTYYNRFYDQRKTDPTGFQSLKVVLGRDDIDTFQKEWEEWLMKLHFP
ncbi:MAG: DUF1570 domain-containing protein [Proteobacteria bacterium]|jgi:hypothetical protein|nr:DUF1570 domain-containing protein [Pseudomonadota bacterium]